MDARFWIELVSAIGYGILSSVVPVFHTEAFIIAGAATGVLGAISMSLGLAVGQLIGKQLIFQAVRQGRRIPVWRIPGFRIPGFRIPGWRRRQPESPPTLSAPHGGTTGEALNLLTPRQQIQSAPTRLERWIRWSSRAARLVEDPKWGSALLFVSAAVGLPPVYAVVLVAGATRMNFWWFSLVLLVGFFVRCYVLTLLTLGVVSLG